MRLWENLTNFYLFLNFLEIPRIFFESQPKVIKQSLEFLSVPCQLSCSNTL